MTGFVPSIQIYFFVFPFGECGNYITLTEYTETVYRTLLKQNPGDQICAYFVISLFCGALTVFVLLAMPIIAACPLRFMSHFTSGVPGDGVCSSQTKDQAIMLFLIKCSGVTDQLLHQGDVLKDNWEGAISGSR